MQMKHIMKIKIDNKKVHYDVQVSSGFIVISDREEDTPREMYKKQNYQ